MHFLSLAEKVLREAYDYAHHAGVRGGRAGGRGHGWAWVGRRWAGSRMSGCMGG